LQVQAVASGAQADLTQQPGQAYPPTSASQTQHNDAGVSSDPPHSSSLPSAAAAARRFVLPTILESSIGSGSGTSRAASECSRTVPLSSNGSSGPSELGFDTIELPEVVESGPSTKDSSVSGMSSQTTDATGRSVITMVIPEEVRVLKDSAKEVHEDTGSKVHKGEQDTDTQSAANPVATRRPASRLVKVSINQALCAFPVLLDPCQDVCGLSHAASHTDTLKISCFDVHSIVSTFCSMLLL